MYQITARLQQMPLLQARYKQPKIRRGFDHGRNIPLAMIFPDNYKHHHLRGKLKGAEVILRERRLWPPGGRRSDGTKFRLSCSTTYDRSGCDPDISGGCCACSVA